MLALGAKLPLEQPVQVRLERLDQLPLLIEHEVQRLHIGRITLQRVATGNILSNYRARESSRDKYLAQLMAVARAKKMAAIAGCA